MAKYNYLQKGRLSDVLSLIQVLALHNSQSLTKAEIEGFLEKPNSTADWGRIVEEHSEFFYHDSGNQRIYLTLRKLEPSKLEVPQMMELLNAASALHDRELGRKKRNAHWIPLGIAILTTAVSVFSLLYTSFNSEKAIRKVIQEEISVLKKETGSAVGTLK